MTALIKRKQIEPDPCPCPTFTLSAGGQILTITFDDGSPPIVYNPNGVAAPPPPPPPSGGWRSLLADGQWHEIPGTSQTALRTAFNGALVNLTNPALGGYGERLTLAQYYGGMLVIGQKVVAGQAGHDGQNGAALNALFTEDFTGSVVTNSVTQQPTPVADILPNTTDGFNADGLPAGNHWYMGPEVLPGGASAIGIIQGPNVVSGGANNGIYGILANGTYLPKDTYAPIGVNPVMSAGAGGFAGGLIGSGGARTMSSDGSLILHSNPLAASIIYEYDAGLNGSATAPLKGKTYVVTAGGIGMDVQDLCSMVARPNVTSGLRDTVIAFRGTGIQGTINTGVNAVVFDLPTVKGMERLGTNPPPGISITGLPANAPAASKMFFDAPNNRVIIKLSNQTDGSFYTFPFNFNEATRPASVAVTLVTKTFAAPLTSVPEVTNGDGSADFSNTGIMKDTDGTLYMVHRTSYTTNLQMVKL